MGFINTIKNLVKGKIEETNQELIEKNPEVILDEAIIDQKKQYRVNEMKIAEMQGQFTEHQLGTEKLKQSLMKIQQGISLAQRNNDIEAVAEGTELFKQRESELAERIEIEKEITTSIEEITEFMKEQRREIEKLESEKISLLARLNSANVKEGIMDLKSSMTFNNSNSFATAREAINKKINKINGRETINKATNQTSSKYFKGL